MAMTSQIFESGVNGLRPREGLTRVAGQSQAKGPAIRRLEALPPETSAADYFSALKDAIGEYYLAEPDNPYRQSGRGSGEARWVESRKCIAEAVDRDGTFLDVGCANGLLLESLQKWLAPRDIRIEPHGVDFVPELVDLARKRLLDTPARNFHVANVWDWLPPRKYDFVRTNLDYVPERLWTEWVERQFRRLVAPGGRLILCWYYSSSEAKGPQPSPARFLAGLGLNVSGTASAIGTEVAWVDKAGARAAG